MFGGQVGAVLWGHILAHCSLVGMVAPWCFGVPNLVPHLVPFLVPFLVHWLGHGQASLVGAAVVFPCSAICPWCYWACCTLAPGLAHCWQVTWHLSGPATQCGPWLSGLLGAKFGTLLGAQLVGRLGTPLGAPLGSRLSNHQFCILELV